MKKSGLIAGVFALVLGATSAYAEDGKSYAGVSAGAAFNDVEGVESQSDLRLNLGHDFGTIRFEADYDYMHSDNFTGHMVSGMTFVEHTFENTVTPYVGMGVGYVFLGDDKVAGDKDDWAYILAAGVSYTFTPRWDIVAEYRYVDSQATVSDSKFRTNQVTMGARYHF